MKILFRLLLLTLLWPGLLAVAGMQAQKAAPSAPASTAAPAAPAAPAADEPKPQLRRLDEAPADTKTADETPVAVTADEAKTDEATAGAKADDATAAPVEAAATKDAADATDETRAEPVRRNSRRDRRNPGRANRNDDRVSVFANTHVAATETVNGAAVAIMGDVTVDGRVEQDAVAVMGDNTVNGIVRGQVVAVLGDVTLGPKARVSGDVVCVGGVVSRDPAAVVEGKIVQQAVGKTLHVGVPLSAWWTQALGRGRPLAFGAHLAWLWVVTAVTLLFYVLLALAFPRAVRRCGDQLVERPGLTILTALLSMIALPVLFVLLLITIIGIPVAFIALPVGVLLAVLFGKAAIYALVGRGVTGGRVSPVIAVLLGAAIFLLLYLVPILGIGLSFIVSLLGFGCAVLALITSSRKPAPLPVGPPLAGNAPAIVPPPVVAAAAVAESAIGGEMPPTMLAQPGAAGPGETAPRTDVPPPVSPVGLVPPPVIPAPAPVPRAEPPPLAAIALPRAGFWLRTAAMLIDLVLVGMIVALVHGSGALVVLLLAAYGATMWKLKGTTVGGIVCGIKVVRLDSRPLDWPTAVVRALGCFLSLAIAGLGFVWVAFDDETQSWHDKIAGTIVVKTPKGESLV